MEVRVFLREKSKLALFSSKTKSGWICSTGHKGNIPKPEPVSFLTGSIGIGHRSQSCLPFASSGASFGVSVGSPYSPLFRMKGLIKYIFNPCSVSYFATD